MARAKKIHDEALANDVVEHSDVELEQPTSEATQVEANAGNGVMQVILTDKVMVKIINHGKERYEPFIQKTIPHGESHLELETIQQKQYLINNLMQLNMLFGRKQFVVE